MKCQTTRSSISVVTCAWHQQGTRCLDRLQLAQATGITYHTVLSTTVKQEMYNVHIYCMYITQASHSSKIEKLMSAA